MATYYDISHPNPLYSRRPAFEPSRPRYDPVTEASPRVPRAPSADDRPIGRVTRQPSQESTPTRTLPGLSELFASKLLVAPNAKKGRTATGSQSGTYNDQTVKAASAQLPTGRHDSVVGWQSPPRYTTAPALSSSAPTTPDAWTSELPPFQNAQRHSSTQHGQANPASPAFRSESFGASGLGGHNASWAPEHTISRHGYGPLPTHHHEDNPLHRVDSRVGWREAESRPAVAELLPATYMYRTDCGMIAGPPSYPDCPVGFPIPGREDLYPIWDLTKRKLPRKRMSTACTDCRKKKIRCEPGVGGCLQCRKVQKPCVIEPVKRRRRKKALSEDADAEDSDDGSEELEKSRPR
ncbi:hypothetical protein DOTSEDRAFT_75786 [Dothistroma septosporum NZE10]|uniref:Zn(2)-C6 fungal-type domain-containing protein n=1 Tax=Dothistroma septosporum (strain NZE10 / CBS 128990) TaxID=675120 RepID=N1PD41_DOTSN|nr:hypothetical protein DOTSEDRAFT_75786 [Dothistroma septosporum NZE10]